MKSFLKAVRSAALGGGWGKARKAGRPKKAAAVPKTRKRAIITAAIRARVKKFVQAGKSGSKIAKAVGISLPSVQNIKKALGIVKSRGSKAKKAPAKERPAKKRLVRKVPAKKAPAAPQPPAPTTATPRAIVGSDAKRVDPSTSEAGAMSAAADKGVRGMAV